MPEDIKSEIVKAYKLDSRASTPRSFDDCSVASSAELKLETKSAFHQLNANQVKEAIRNWLSSEKEPKQFDTSMLANFFKELALNRKIEYLQAMFNFLHRYVILFLLFFYTFLCLNL